MSRIKSIFSACFAVVIFCAFVSTSAYAGGEWDVNGTPLVTTAALASAAVVLRSAIFKSDTASPIEIECKAHEFSISEGVLVHPDAVLAKSLTFRECALTTGGSSCALASPLIATLPVHGLAHLDEGLRLNTLILVLPETKTTFATIKFEGETCAFFGTEAITGAFHFLIDEGYLPEESHLVLAVTLKGGLKIGSVEALLAGLDGDLRLASGATWNFL